MGKEMGVVSKSMEQITGIEPAWLPWQGSVLPLNYICIKCANII